MQTTDLIGYIASALVLATFYMRSMRTLRCVALASNLAFIGYACLAHLIPVLVLHTLLLLLNGFRLLQERETSPAVPTLKVGSSCERL